MFIVGCSSTPLEKKRKNTIECVKDLMENDAETLDAFSVCRTVYKMKLVKEAK
jgi:hypothetical protein